MDIKNETTILIFSTNLITASAVIAVTMITKSLSHLLHLLYITSIFLFYDIINNGEVYIEISNIVNGDYRGKLIWLKTRIFWTIWR